MFTLRKITASGVEMNFILGKNYTIVYRRDTEDFKRTMDAYTECNPENFDPKIYAFVSNEGGELIPLWEPQQCYIMCSDGKTYDNVSP